MWLALLTSYGYKTIISGYYYFILNPSYLKTRG